MVLKGKKFKMTQVWENDIALPVTLIEVSEGLSDIDFKAGDLVTVSGKTKGRGFQGGVKRHGFHGGPQTHGQKNRWRAPGSIGATAPQRVLIGTHMAGRMGGDKVTLKNLTVVAIDNEKGLVSIKGAVPGRRGTVVTIAAIKKS